MMLRQLLLALLVCMMMLIPTGTAWAAPGGPNPGPSPLPCSWQGALYPHGAIRKETVTFQRTVIRYDYYQCQNSQWIYIGSSDD